MGGRDEDCATRVSSLANEEPLVVVKACVDIVWEVVREDCGNSRGSVVGEGEASLCRGGRRSGLKRAFGAEDGDVGRSRGSSSHWGSEVFASGGGDEHVVGINGDVFMKWGEEESVKDFLSYTRGSGRHRWWEGANEVALL